MSITYKETNKEKDYKLEILKIDGTAPDYSDATFITIKETMTMKEFRRRQKEGLIPDFTPYVITN